MVRGQSRVIEGEGGKVKRGEQHTVNAPGTATRTTFLPFHASVESLVASARIRGEQDPDATG